MTKSDMCSHLIRQGAFLVGEEQRIVMSCVSNCELVMSTVAC
jgi:hypothetical protein